MKKICLGLALVAGCTLPALAGTDIGVSIGISQPGVYGRIDIGSVSAPPVLVYPQPVVIARRPRWWCPRPMYLHVPPGHAKNWRKHCARYDACGRPVYFVQEDWYEQHYGGAERQGQRQGPRQARRRFVASAGAHHTRRRHRCGLPGRAVEPGIARSAARTIGSASRPQNSRPSSSIVGTPKTPRSMAA